MSKRIEDNYAKLIQSLYHLLKQTEELKASIRPITEIAETIKAPFETISQTTEITQNMTSALEAYVAAVRPIIRTADLNKVGLLSREIAELVNIGKLERIKHGYYQLAESENSSDAKLISDLYPDGVLCMTTALFYYGYSDRTPLTWDIAVDRNTSKARFNIDYPYVKPYYIDKSHLDYGITEAVYEDYILKIFDRDRLICECIKHENKMDREIYNKAIQAYINDNKKNVTNLLDYAKRRNIHKKVRERIGVWL